MKTTKRAAGRVEAAMVALFTVPMVAAQAAAVLALHLAATALEMVAGLTERTFELVTIVAEFLAAMTAKRPAQEAPVVALPVAGVCVTEVEIDGRLQSIVAVPVVESAEAVYQRVQAGRRVRYVEVAVTEAIEFGTVLYRRVASGRRVRYAAV